MYSKKLLFLGLWLLRNSQQACGFHVRVIYRRTSKWAKLFSLKVNFRSVSAVFHAMRLSKISLYYSRKFWLVLISCELEFASPISALVVETWCPTFEPFLQHHSMFTLRKWPCSEIFGKLILVIRNLPDCDKVSILFGRESDPILSAV